MNNLTRDQLLEIDYYLRLTRSLEERLVALFRQAKVIGVEIVDLRSILPFDEEAILESVAKTNRAIILHEAPLTGGAGAEFAARIAEKAFDYLDAPVKRIGALDVPMPYSPPLEAFAMPNKDKVIAAARELLAY